MADAIRIENVKGDAFRVSYVNQDASTAQKVAGRLAAFIIDESTKDRTGLAQDTSIFLAAQRTGRPILVFSGGEPLMRPDIFDLASEASRRLALDKQNCALRVGGGVLDALKALEGGSGKDEWFLPGFPLVT